MRLAYLCADRGVPVAGTKGASIHLRAVVAALERRGHQVPVLAASSAGSESLSFEVRDIGFDRPLKNLRQKLESETGNRSLAGEIHGLLLNRRTRQELDRLHAERPLDALYERYSLWSWQGLRFARANRLPLILEVNAPLVAEQEAYRGLELGDAARSVAAEVLRGADVVVVPSAELVPYVEDEVGRDRPIEVVPNGVDVELFERPRRPTRPPWQPSPDGFVVAFLGSLKPWHGIDILLEAFDRLRRHRIGSQLLVIGDGPLRDSVEAARSRCGSDAVHVTGAVSHAEVPYWLSLADVGVAPYPGLDRFYFSPLKVVEYMAAELPVVASRIGQLRDTVRHGETGLLVEPDDPATLAEALEELADDPERRRRMGRSGQQRAFHEYSWAAVAERVERLTTALLESRELADAVQAADPTEVSLWA